MANGNGNGNGWKMAAAWAAVILSIIAMAVGGTVEITERPHRAEVNEKIAKSEARSLSEIDKAEKRMEANLDRKLELILYRLDEIQKGMQ